VTAATLPALLGYGHWLPIRDGDPRGLALYLRHYCARRYRDGRRRTLFTGPGERLVLLTYDASALFIWRKFRDSSGQQGVNCAVFRNEGPVRSSDLIREACEHAWQRWPGERLYTYVNPRRVASANPGYCFKVAGWSHARDAAGQPLRTRGGLLILEIAP
jgi:hypothetical protein